MRQNRRAMSHAIALCALLLLRFQSTEPGRLEVAPTAAVAGTAAAPKAVVQVSLRDAPAGAFVELIDEAGGARARERAAAFGDGVPRLLTLDAPAGGAFTARLVEGDAALETVKFTVPKPDPGWTMYLVPGFHFDPVWWNTQANYAETGRLLDAHQGPGIGLVDAYLEQCAKNPEFKVALHQLPYLKTWIEANPKRLGELRALVREGRVGVVGGTYNELSSTLVSGETALRSAVYGSLFQREVLGGSGRTAWQCDVFGHDPSFPSLMAQAGLSAASFARGPFHQWGAPRDKVNFPSEFLWTSPDGRSLLTHYQTGHYGYGYEKLAYGSNRGSADRELTNAQLAAMFDDLKRPALTHHVLVPMHMDFVRPLENLCELVQAWNQTYISPRVVIDTADGFFAAVEREVRERGIVPPAITRDMNPIYTGCPVSFGDLKAAQRECEDALRQAELWSTLAWLEGAPYPSRSLDRAWRQLLFNAHHDAVTGSMSDQVYLDVMSGYRDALEQALESTRYACDRIRRFNGLSGIATTDIVWNSIPREREGIPAVGYKVREHVEPPNGVLASTILENEFLRVTLDLDRGGAISSIFDKQQNREWLRGAGNDVVVLEEYPNLPGHGEGPWHLAPTGKRAPGTKVRAQLSAAPAPPGTADLTAEYPTFTKRQTLKLRPGSRVLECETQILNYRGRNELLRVEFPIAMPGARPLCETAAAVIARPFSREVGTAKDPWTLDQAFHGWAGFGAAFTLEASFAGERRVLAALGVGEITIPRSADAALRRAANELAVALVRWGVTTTIVEEGSRPYGDLAVDSNAPDFRIRIGPFERLRYLEDDGERILEIPTAQLTNKITHIAREPRWLLQPTEVEATAAAGVTAGTAALLSGGPSSVHFGAEGTLGLNLLRSNTSWPAGAWIDEPRRRHPDGSPLGSMHGSHSFRYALLVDPRDFREAEVSARAAEFRAPLGILFSLLEGGNGKRSRSYLEVVGQGIELWSLKPEGYGEAQWKLPATQTRPGAKDAWIVARLWNGAGRHRSVSLKSEELTILEAQECDALERPVRPLTVQDGSVQVGEMAPWSVISIRLRVPRAADREVVAPARPADVARPWLENLGEGTYGNGALGVVPAQRFVVLGTEAMRIPVFFVNRLRDTTLTVHGALSAGDLPGVRLEWNSTQLPPERSAEGAILLDAKSLVAALGDRAAAIELTATASAGSDSLATKEVVWVATDAKAFDKAFVEMDLLPLQTSEDSSGKFVKGRGLVAGSLGISWERMGPRARWGKVEAMYESELWQFAEVIGLANIRRPEQLPTYEIIKAHGGGRVAYSNPTALTADRSSKILRFGSDVVRLKPGDTTIATVRLEGFADVMGTAKVAIAAPAGWSTRQVAHRAKDSEGIRSVDVDFEIKPASDAPSRGVLSATCDGNSASAAYSIAPQAVARPGLDSLSIDGDLSEWTAEEFIEAKSDLGSFRFASRYGATGLAFAFEVPDDVHRQPERNATIWRGDSIQMALSISPAVTSGYSGKDLEFGAALTSSGPLVWCWYGGDGGATGRVDGARCAIVRAADRTRYELLLPKSSLPKIPLDAQAVLGLGCIANDDDGTGYRGAVQWTPGMTGGKDSSLFGELLLVPRKP